TAVRGRFVADVAAGPAVVRIRIQESARPIAVVSASDAVVSTKSGDARDVLVGRRRTTLRAAASAVVDVVVMIGTMAAATGVVRTLTASGLLSARPRVHRCS